MSGSPLKWSTVGWPIRLRVGMPITPNLSPPQADGATGYLHFVKRCQILLIHHQMMSVRMMIPILPSYATWIRFTTSGGPPALRVGIPVRCYRPAHSNCILNYRPRGPRLSITIVGRDFMAGSRRTRPTFTVSGDVGFAAQVVNAANTDLRPSRAQVVNGWVAHSLAGWYSNYAQSLPTASRWGTRLLSLGLLFTSPADVGICRARSRTKTPVSTPWQA